MRACSDASKERFTGDLIREVTRKGKRDTIAVADRDRLDWILKEKKLQVTGLTEKTASSIGGLAGLDFIMLGSMQYNEPDSLVVTVIRVRDGAILGVAEERAIILLDETAPVDAHSSKSLSFMVTKGGVLKVQARVLTGNPLHISLLSSGEFEKYKKHKRHKYHIEFESDKTLQYSRSLYLPEGEYFLVLTDTAFGVASEKRSVVRVRALVDSRQ